MKKIKKEVTEKNESVSVSESKSKSFKSSFDNLGEKSKKSFSAFYKGFFKNSFLDSFSEKWLKRKISKIYRYVVISDIFILVFMFFSSVFLNAKSGYYLDSIHFDRYNSLYVPGIIFGLFAFIVYMPNITYSVAIFVKLFILKKEFKNLNFYVHSLLSIFNFLIILVSILSIFVEYRFVFLIELIMIFHFIIGVYLKLDEKYEMNFTFIKKLNDKILSKDFNLFNKSEKKKNKRIII